MKHVLGLVILFSVNISGASLASDLANALKQSTADKQALKVNLQVDDTSVDAKWSTASEIVLNETSDLIVDDIASIDIANFTPEKEEEEVRDEVREMARELKESHSVAKESSVVTPVVDAR